MTLHKIKRLLNAKILHSPESSSHSPCWAPYSRAICSRAKTLMSSLSLIRKSKERQSDRTPSKISALGGPQSSQRRLLFQDRPGQSPWRFSRSALLASRWRMGLRYERRLCTSFRERAKLLRSVSVGRLQMMTWTIDYKRWDWANQTESYLTIGHPGWTGKVITGALACGVWNTPLQISTRLLSSHI